MESIGEKIHQLRKRSGKSQEELSFDLGVSRQTVSKWESGLMSPSVENLKALSLIFGVGVEFFLSEDANVEVQSIANEKIENKAKKDEIAVANDKNESKTKTLLILNLIFNGLVFCIFMILILVLVICELHYLESRYENYREPVRGGYYNN